MRSPSFVLLPSCFFFLNTTRSAQGQNTKENGVNSSRRDQARFSSSFLLAAKAKTSSSSAFWMSDTKFSLKTQQAAQSLMRWKKKWSHYPKLGLNHHSEIVLSRLLRTIINAGEKVHWPKEKSVLQTIKSFSRHLSSSDTIRNQCHLVVISKAPRTGGNF